MTNATAYLLVAFVFGNSKTNGIIYGVRYGLPNKAKPSTDFEGTFYKVVTDDHGAKKIYRYIPLDQVDDVLDATNTGQKILSKCLTPDQLEEVEEIVSPQPGELWEDEDGNRYIVTYDGALLDTNGEFYSSDIFPVRRVARKVTLNAAD